MVFFYRLLSIQIGGIELACPWILVSWIVHMPRLTAAPGVGTSEVIELEKFNLPTLKGLIESKTERSHVCQTSSKW